MINTSFRIRYHKAEVDKCRTPLSRPKGISQETRELISSVITQFLSTYKRRKPHNKQIRRRIANKGMDLLKQPVRFRPWRSRPRLHAEFKGSTEADREALSSDISAVWLMSRVWGKGWVGYRSFPRTSNASFPSAVDMHVSPTHLPFHQNPAPLSL